MHTRCFEDSKEWNRCESPWWGRTTNGTAVLYSLSLVCKCLYEEYKDHHSSYPGIQSLFHHEHPQEKIAAAINQQQRHIWLLLFSFHFMLIITTLIYNKDKHADAGKDTYIIGCDCACRVTGHELQLHVNFTKQVLVFGMKSRARGLVHGQGEKLPIVEDFGTTITPSYLKVLVQVTCRGCYHKDYEEKANRYVTCHFSYSNSDAYCLVLIEFWLVSSKQI